MTSNLESELKTKFVDRLNSGRIEGVKVIYRMSGGAHGEFVNEEVIISGTNDVGLKMKDETRSQMMQEFSTQIDRNNIQSLFRNIEGGMNSLVPAGKAGFLPDSLVGSITLEVDGKKSNTYYFLVDEDDRISQGKPVSPQIIEAVRGIEDISKRFRR
jgi:hypothetical protein